MDHRSQKIEEAFENRDLIQQDEYRETVLEVIDALDKGELRVAEKKGEASDSWEANAWVMKAISLYFGVAEMRKMTAGEFEYHDKIPTKKDLDKAGVRVVPPGTVRYGSHVEAGAVVEIPHDDQRVAMVEMVFHPFAQPDALCQLLSAVFDGQAHDVALAVHAVGGLRFRVHGTVLGASGADRGSPQRPSTSSRWRRSLNR